MQQVDGCKNEDVRFEDSVHEDQNLEILVFRISGSDYAIEVSQVREILMIGEISKVPNAGQAIAGIGLVRGDLVTVIDLRFLLQRRRTEEHKQKLALLCEIEDMKAAFLVDEVSGIERIQQREVSSMNRLIPTDQVVGSVNINNSIILMVEANRIIEACRMVSED